ncbi:uncharacterized protein LOC107363909 [Tetranychus urticae]|uniref:uncharacterized protein LOC107363909 n=1 Tax=Tetranychus urticae TaxID=32264 RepID=UPI00077B93E7|nr:uncharacterized protein LOC107363909 [Tetranychus urticae]
MSSTTLTMKFRAIARFKRFVSHINQFFGQNLDPFKGIEHLYFLEESSKRLYISYRGYSNEKTKLSTDYLLKSVLIEIGNFLAIGRLTLLCFTSNAFVTTYLGDFYINTTIRFYMNNTLAVVGWLVVLMRSMLFWQDINHQREWLSTFAFIKCHGFNASLLKITSSGANQLRNKVYLTRIFYTVTSLFTAFFIAALIFYSFLSNPYSYLSRRLLFCQLFWASLTIWQAYIDVSSTVWLVAHIYLLTVYCSLQLDAVDLSIARILTKRSSNGKSPHFDQCLPNQALRSLVVDQNYAVSCIYKFRSQIKHFISLGYFYACFGADFMFYSVSVMPTDQILYNIIVAGLGVETMFISMTIILILSKVSAKAAESYGKYHMIIEEAKPGVTTKRMVSGVLETIGDSFIGFYIGDVFKATMNQYVEFVLGNCSMMLMLISTMRQIS